MCALSGAPAAHAAEARPTVGPGASKEQVIDAYGWPSGQSRLGTKEILNYPQGTVTLRDGRVERVDFSLAQPWPAPRPRPAGAGTAAAQSEAPADFWLVDHAQALAEATRRQVRVLALFTGPDWSPASRQFRDEVEYRREFREAWRGEFVFLRLEYATRSSLPAELRERNAHLRARYGVTDYPTLLVLAPTGDPLAKVDLGAPRTGETYLAHAIAAVGAVRDLLAVQAPPAAKPSAAVAAQPSGRLAASLWAAKETIAGAVGAGVLVAALLYWLVWRAAPFGPSSARSSGRPMSERIAEAASTTPVTVQIARWPIEKVRAVTRALAEYEGYVVEARPTAAECDLLLRHAGESAPAILVRCAPAAEGLVTLKRVRELHTEKETAALRTAWYVAAGGFAADARAWAEQAGIVAIDGERLGKRLGELPPLVLPEILRRA